MIEDEMVSRSYSHSGKVALAVFTVETSYMELVDIESSPDDVGTDEGTGEGSVEPMSVFGLDGEVLVFGSSILQGIIGSHQAEG